MKKLMAGLLAVVLLFGTSAVAFAADGARDLIAVSEDFYLEDEDGLIAIDASGNTRVTPGETAYFPLLGEDDVMLTITDKDTATNFKPYQEWDLGKEYIDSVSIVQKKTNADTTAERYVYFLAVETKDSNVSGVEDVLGTVELRNRKDSSDRVYAYVAFEFGYTATEVYYDSVITNDNPIADFTDCEEIELLFDDLPGVRFEVNAKGQKDLNLAHNPYPDDAIYDEYADDADLTFVNFEESPRFNRTGNLYIEAPAGSYLYELVDGELSLLSADFDEDTEEYMIETRELGSYVISDSRLRLTSSSNDDEEEEESSSEDDEVIYVPVEPSSSTPTVVNPGTPGKVNPDTGYNGFVGAAVLAAAASAACLVFKKRK